MRVLGIDYGERRIGVAISDPTGTFATPLPTLTRRRGKRPPMGALKALARDHGAIALVVGLPLAADGTETDWCAEVRRFGDRLGGSLELDVYYVDERMTSARAEIPSPRSVEASNSNWSSDMLAFPSSLNKLISTNPENLTSADTVWVAKIASANAATFLFICLRPSALVCAR